MSGYFRYPSTGGSGIQTYANFAAFPATAADGSVALALDTDVLYAFNTGLVAWLPIGGPEVALSIGTIDSQTASANGAVLTATTLVLQSASATRPGLVNNTTQTFAGQKTFSTGLTGTLTGSASLNVLTSALGNLTAAGTDGLVVTGGTGSIVGTVSLAQHVADTTHNGYLSSTDWNTFNNKQSLLTLGNLTDAGTDGITVTGGTAAVVGSGTSISQRVADTTHNGYLSSTDWNTFNSKGSGTVTSLSVTSANGFAGSFSGGATPALTLTTTITGILQGNGTAISAASTNGSGNIVLTTNAVLVTPALGTPSALVGTNITGTASGLTAGNVTTNANLTGPITSSGNATSVTNLAITNAMIANSTIDLTAKVTNVLPIANGGTAVSSVTTSPTASSFAGWDANSNLSANNHISKYTTTATAGATTTLTVASTYQQYFTGSLTQIVVLPVASTLVLGQAFLINNLSSGLVTINSSGSNLVQTLQANSSVLVTCILTSGTSAASWNTSNVTPLANQNANALYAGPTSGAAAAPGFRAMVPLDRLYVVSSKTTTYSATTADDLILCSGSAFTVTLPAASTSGKILIIKKTDSTLTNIITISRAGSDTIDGATSTTLNTQYETLTLVSDGTATWNIISRDYPKTPVAYTPVFTGFGTVTNINFVSWRDGAFLHVQGFFTPGTTTAVEAQTTIGFNGSSANVTTVSTIPTIGLAGYAVLNAATANQLNALTEPSKTYMTWGLQGSGSAGLTKENGNAAFGALNYSVFAKFQITGWN